MAHVSRDKLAIDPRSGFCRSNSTFYSKRKPIPLPSNEATTITTFISSRAHHGRVAVLDASTGRHLTFSDLCTCVDSVATCLSDMGVRKGHVVLLLSPNSIYFPVVCHAVMSLGAIVTTTNPLNTPAEIARQVADSRPVLAFTTAEIAPKLAGLNLRMVLMEGNVGGSGNEVVTMLEEMVKMPPGQHRVNERVTMDDTAALLYSSGTTGPSKGVRSSHKNFIAMAQIAVERLRLYERQHTFLCTVPMFHIYGLALFVNGLIGSGSTIVVLPKFEINNMLLAIQRHRVTYLPLVPTILVGLVNNADLIKKKYDLSSLECVLSGGATLAKEVIQGYLEKYPQVTIFQGFGMTETTATGATIDTVEESLWYGSSGLLTPEHGGQDC